MTAVDRRTYCRICPVQCGLVVTVEEGRVVRVRGDRDHPVTAGYTCPKGRAAGALHHHPRRLRGPSIGGRRVGWDDFVDDLAARLGAVLERHGPDAIGAYLGTWSWNDTLGRRAADRFLAAIASRSKYSAVTVDAISRSVVAELMSGSASVLPNLDADGTDLLVLVGTNPVVSHGHSSGIADPVRTLRSIARRGEVWVIDPRRTETAWLATRHLAIRPATDHVLLAHLVRELLAGGADHAYLDAHGRDVDVLAAAVAPFDRSRAVTETGLAPADVDDLVAAVRRHGRLAAFTGTGITMGPSGPLVEWLTWALQVVTGSLDRPGGAWCNPGYLLRLDTRPGAGPRPPGSGAGSRPEIPARYGELPCAVLADEIEAGNLRALLVVGGNPLTALPDPARLANALAGLEVLAVADVVESDTGACATHLIACTDQFERADLTQYGDLFPTVMSAQYTPRVVEPADDQRPLWWVLDRVGRRLGLRLLGDEPPALEDETDLLRELTERSRSPFPQPGDEPVTVVAPEPRPRGWVHERVLAGGRWQLAPPVLVERLTASAPVRELVLVPRRVARRMNSVLRDVLGDDDHIVAHPDDASRSGVSDGDRIVVRSRHGALVGHLRTSSEVARGTVSVPHGLASPNVSRLTSGEPGAVDELTGMVLQSGVPVSLEPHPRERETITS